jgi:hypothetical protein
VCAAVRLYDLAGALAPPAELRLERAELLKLITEMAHLGEPISNAVVRRQTGLDRQDVLSLLEELVREGRLIRVGQRRGTRYLAPGQTARNLPHR